MVTYIFHGRRAVHHPYGVHVHFPDLTTKSLHGSTLDLRVDAFRRNRRCPFRAVLPSLHYSVTVCLVLTGSEIELVGIRNLNAVKDLIGIGVSVQHADEEPIAIVDRRTQAVEPILDSLSKPGTFGVPEGVSPPMRRGRKRDSRRRRVLRQGEDIRQFGS